MEKVKLGPSTLLYPMPAVLVGAVVEGKPNFMTAAWCGIASHKPPAISVALYRERYTLRGINDKGTFSINIPSSDMAEEVDFCGIYSGKKRDKSEVFETFFGSLKTAPLVSKCPVNIECKVIHTLDLGSHTLVIGEIVETFVSKECVTHGNPDPGKIDPLIYTSKAQVYQRLGEVVGKAFSVGKNYKV
ncbi:MAG: flavin reductase family protein [Deltaproteobacteria bacterium]|nr:flavin reductase family protein [Deltaproteobacteria bacterium]